MRKEKSTKLFLNCIVNFSKGDNWQFLVGKFGLGEVFARTLRHCTKIEVTRILGNFTIGLFVD